MSRRPVLISSYFFLSIAEIERSLPGHLIRGGDTVPSHPEGPEQSETLQTLLLPSLLIRLETVKAKEKKKERKRKKKKKCCIGETGKRGAFLDKSSDWNTLTASSVKAICQCAFEKEIQLNAIEHSSKAPVMWHQRTVNEKALVSPLASHTNQLLTSIHCISKQAFPFCKNAYFPVSLISALNEEVKMGLDRSPTVD